MTSKTKETICKCGHPQGQHEVNTKTDKVRCGVIVNGRRCPCLW